MDTRLMPNDRELYRERPPSLQSGVAKAVSDLVEIDLRKWEVVGKRVGCRWRVQQQDICSQLLKAKAGGHHSRTQDLIHFSLHHIDRHQGGLHSSRATTTTAAVSHLYNTHSSHRINVTRHLHGNISIGQFSNPTAPFITRHRP